MSPEPCVQLQQPGKIGLARDLLSISSLLLLLVLLLLGAHVRARLLLRTTLPKET